jgi:CDP-glycerol glycerophosphotransferase (TagB/SpsB family)
MTPLFYKYIRNIVFLLLNFINLFFIIFKINKNFIIFSSNQENQYNDNSRYLFEYLSKKKLNVFWITNSKKVQQYLTEHGLKYISFSNFLKLFYVSLKTKIVFSTGSDYFNCCSFLKNKEVLKIHLGHGAGNKVVIQKYIGTKIYENYSKFDLVNFTSDFTIKEIGLKNYKLDNKKIKKLGYPRLDNLEKSKNKNKSYLRKILGKVYKDQKIILYTPTWRPYKYTLPILGLKGFALKNFNKFLKDNGVILCISFHSLGPANFKKLNLSNILYLDKEKYIFFDTTYFLNFVDILINDCSTTSTDFATKKKPQIFVFPDYEKYIKHTSFLEDYRKNLPGKFINNYISLKKEIFKNLKSNNNYKNNYSKEIKLTLKKYYSFSKNHDSNHEFLKLIKNIKKIK